MTSARQQQLIYLALLEKHGKLIAQAFLRVVRSVTASVNFTELTQAIDRGDIDRIAQLTGLTEQRLFPLSEAIRTAYIEGGMSVGQLAGAQFGFDGRHPRAERFIADHAGKLVQGIAEESRSVITEVVAEGIREGRSSTKVARDLIGLGRQRKGGTIGLTKEQSEWVSGARRQLDDLDSGYFRRKLRDKRFDGTVRKAIREGKPLTQAQIDKITGRYSERVEAYRARGIARHETRQAITAGQAEGFWQIKASDDVEDVTVRWQHNDAAQDPRPDHIRAGQEAAHSLGTPWIMDDGTQMMHPHDPEGGPSQNMGCRCNPIWRVILKAE